MSDIFGSWENRPTIQDEFAEMFANRADEIRAERERAEQERERRQAAHNEAADTLGRLLKEADNA